MKRIPKQWLVEGAYLELRIPRLVILRHNLGAFGVFQNTSFDLYIGDGIPARRILLSMGTTITFNVPDVADKLKHTFLSFIHWFYCSSSEHFAIFNIHTVVGAVFPVCTLFYAIFAELYTYVPIWLLLRSNVIVKTVGAVFLSISTPWLIMRAASNVVLCCVVLCYFIIIIAIVFVFVFLLFWFWFWFWFCFCFCERDILPLQLHWLINRVIYNSHWMWTSLYANAACVICLYTVFISMVITCLKSIRCEPVYMPIQHAMRHMFL